MYEEKIIAQKKSYVKLSYIFILTFLFLNVFKIVICEVF